MISTRLFIAFITLYLVVAYILVFSALPYIP